MPVELALDLAALALYDIVIFADDSGSMAFEENGERIDDLKLIGSKVWSCVITICHQAGKALQHLLAVYCMSICLRLGR
jgi:hypothetical protein